MQELLEYDFVKQEVLTKLSPLALYNMKLCDNFWNKYITLAMIKESIIKEINIRLSLIFGDKYDKFNKILDDTKAIISGSFIIQCILGEYWEDSDIDIYFPTINNKMYLTDSNNPYYELEKFLYETLKFNMTQSYRAISRYRRDQSNDKLNIEYVRNYDTFTNSIQIIQAKIKNDPTKMKEFIYDTFDFDICKNVYYIKDGKGYLNILKLNDIFNKISEFKIGYRVGSSIQRYEKYTKRGFSITNNMIYDELANKGTRTKANTYSSDSHNGIIFLYHMKEICINKYELENKKFAVDLSIFEYSGDIIVKNKRNLTIKRKQNVCHDNCLMRFYKSDQKHICYDTKRGQCIFIID